MCVLILDIDHFKNYNDLHGNLGGDVALVAMSNVLKSNIRPCDYAVRIGGEEFMVLLPNTQHSDGLKLAERIRLEIEQKTILHADGGAMPGVTVSIGIAINDQQSTSKTIFAAADKQLYLAKHSGRNCVK
ncbi:MAG: GGDEF domain-containing protein [Gammaproteobacteria bacterium]|nr:GGDEF domain-containing protein [Gammaproteobacteria bacterium]